MARDCAHLGGQRQPLIALMRQLWARVDFMSGEEGSQRMDDGDEDGEGEGSGDQQQSTSAQIPSAVAASLGGGSDTEGDLELERAKESESNAVLTGVAASGQGGCDTPGALGEQRDSARATESPESDTSQAAEHQEVPVSPHTSSQGGGEGEEDLTVLEGQSDSHLKSDDDSKEVSFPSLDSTDKNIFPSIQEKLEKFEPDDTIKRKAETSPELSKNEKKDVKK